MIPAARTQVYLQSFNGVAWVAPASGSASGGGVSQGAAGGASQLAIATDGTRIDLAWTQTVGALTQIMLREVEWKCVGRPLGQLHRKRREPTPCMGQRRQHWRSSTARCIWLSSNPAAAGSSQFNLIARRHDGVAWSESNSLASPIAGATGALASPTIAVGGGQLRIGWIDQRYSPIAQSHTAFARFNGNDVRERNWAWPVPTGSTRAPSASFWPSIRRAARSQRLLKTAPSAPWRAGPQSHAFSSPAQRRACSRSSTANDLGAGDAILVTGSVAGFTVAGDDAGVLITGDRATSASVIGPVAIVVAGVQLENLTLSTVNLTGANASILNCTLIGVTTVRATSVTIAGNFITQTVKIDQAGASGTISGNRFDGSLSSAAVGLSVTAAFSGPIRGNSFTGFGTAILLAASASVGGNTVSGNSVGAGRQQWRHTRRGVR